ncbi:MAG: N-acetylmuramoyl-L-alanine amidase [Acidimicrobiaceae bacterium]|nr:N-acetylmuramoyl-L-alanine amidase [Acidimicrobiaceae bacterium]
MKLRYRALLLVVALVGFAVACASEGGGDELGPDDTTTTAAPRTTVADTTTTTVPETTVADTTTTTAAPRTTAADTTTTTSVPEDSTPQEDPQSSAPAGLVTPTGIPVAVLGRSETGYLVRTPCGNTAEVSKGVFINGARVVIDPGHGGPVDTGAIGPNGLIERDLNLTLSRAILDELASRGISAVSTRTGGYGTLLSVRAALANDLGVDALISIHHNAPTWAISRSPGSEVFIQSESISLPRADSARLGGLLYEEITAALATFDNVTWSKAANAGVLRVLSSNGTDAYGMIVRPTVPAVLVEYGYLSNPSEAALFATDEYIRVAATATADAIDAYLHTDRPGTGFIQRPRIFDPQRAPSFCEDPPLE